MSKLGALAGLGVAGLAYMGLDSAGLIDPIFDYIRTTPGSQSETKQFVDGLMTVSGITGAIGTVGEVAKKTGKSVFNMKNKKSLSTLEGAVDSGLVYTLMSNQEGKEFLRDNLFYKWDMYSANIEGGLETIAGMSSIAFLLAFAYTSAKSQAEKLDKE